MTEGPLLVWFRRDLRLGDNPALHRACSSGAPVIPVYIHDDTSGKDDISGKTGGRPIGGASRWWLHHSLAALDASLRALGSRLILRQGPALDVLSALIAETGAEGVSLNRLYDGPSRERDSLIKAALKSRGVHVESFNASLLVEPWDIATKSGTPFRVFTPFWNSLRDRGDPAPPCPAPATIPSPDAWPASDLLYDWKLLPRSPDWAEGLRAEWQPGEQSAAERLDAFLADDLENYPELRDNPARNATSRLSPHLHFGELSPREIWARTRAATHRKQARATSGLSFLRQIAWREFSTYLLYHSPDLGTLSWNPNFRELPWRNDIPSLMLWQKGQTGYPIVDAGMRELWTTGIMHNRVRMIAASFLVKDLLIDWRLGESWFWDTLVDADPANNASGWQWVAGSGADASPYFRVFNPTLQGEKFDPAGEYIRRWVPELTKLPNKYIHRPWAAPDDIRKAAAVTLGLSYPHPMVDHAAARERALIAYGKIKLR